MESVGFRIEAEARSLLGTPYRHLGRDPKMGVDCAGLIAVVRSRVFRMPLPDLQYSRNPGMAHMVRLVLQYTKAAIQDEIGDVVILSVCGKASHLGIRSSGGVIHASEATGRVTESLIGSGLSIAARFRLNEACSV